MPKYTNEEFNTWYVNEARTQLAAEGFDNVRIAWKKGLKDHKAQSRYLAEEALELFAKHGNIDKLNTVLSDLKNDARNYLRPAAFAKWAIAHQPLKYENEKLVKDRETGKTTGEYATLMVEALAMPYWDFAPDTEIVKFGAADIVTALENVLKKYTGKKYTPKDDAAVHELTQAMMKVAELRRLVPIAALVAATPASAMVHKSPEAETIVVAASADVSAAA